MSCEYCGKCSAYNAYKTRTEGLTATYTQRHIGYGTNQGSVPIEYKQPRNDCENIKYEQAH